MGRWGSRRIKASVVGPLVAVALASAAPAEGAVTPIVDCMTPTGTDGVFSVYYGYVNPGAQVSIPFGDANTITPGLGFQGQPEVFNSGSYPRVLRAVFNSNAFTGIAWELDGSQGVATTATPLCAAGATGPVSDLGVDAATLHGIIDSEGVDTAYRFEYGETIAYGEQTPERQLTSASGRLVSEPIGGLAPGTTYHYRLLADGLESTVGEDRTFTTRSTPVVPAPHDADLVVSRSGPARAKVGRKVTVTLTVRNLGPASASGVRLIGRAGRGLRIASMLSPAGPCTGARTRECPVGTIDPGSTAAVSMRISAKRRGRFAYRATVAGDQPETRVLDNTAEGTLRGR